MANMKMSLLEMVQNILSALNSDQVNSVSDTPESLQVAEAIKSTYFNMLGRYDLPEHNQFFNLQPSNDLTKPVLMYKPEGVTRLEWLKYFDSNPADGSAFQTDQYGAYSHDVNTDLEPLTEDSCDALNYPGYKEVHIIPIEDFVRLNSALNQTESDVESFTLTLDENTTGTLGTFTFYYFNDRQPMHCCIVGNNYIIFDSYDNTQDSTLQSSKTMAYGWVYPTFQMTDTFIPDLDAQQFPLLLNDAKSLAFYEIKNQPHQKAEEEVSRQVVSLQKWKAIANAPTYFEQLPDFGRRGRGQYP